MRSIVLLCTCLLFFSITEGRTSRVDQQRQMYYQALEEQVALSESRAARYLNKLQFNPQFARDFDQAKRMSDVKKSLVNRFKNSKALEDSSVRWMLLEVVKKNNITEEDLTSLQQHVNKVLGRE